MYTPLQFRAKTTEQGLSLVRQYPFATLISCDDAGFPFVTHLPLHLEQGDDTEPTRLLGHVARGNPHWRYLAQRPDALVSFMGPHAYLSPQVYPDLARVPTWNYLAVSCKVNAKVIDEAPAKDALLKKLIGDHEPAYAEQWRNLGDEFAQKMLAGIVAFELTVTAMDCKLKLNQHRPESHVAMHSMYAQGNDDQRALAHWMENLGLTIA
jgi:transcriptional regulator